MSIDAAQHHPLERGVFTFSLDFELAWGTRGGPKAAAVAPYLAGTRTAITALLDLFSTYDVSATWAVVGAMFLAGRGAHRRHEWLSPSRFDDVPPGDAATQPFWYADDVLAQLRQCAVRQELGCHTLTHAVVDPGPRGRSRLRQEIALFVELFDQLGLERPVSFIYPRGRIGHLEVLAEAGFRCFRGPECRWYESLPGELTRAGVRLLDAHSGVCPPVGEPACTAEGLWLIPSSQFYAPFMSVGRFVPLKARVQKAVRGLRRAARHRRVFHLWTHPFNLGMRTAELLAGLDAILREAGRLRAAGELEILPMGELAARLDAAGASGSSTAAPCLLTTAVP